MRQGRVLGVVMAMAAALFIAGSGASTACEVGTEVLITEFMALNGSGVVDENNSTEDWIEIYNPCLPSVDLGGWYLTDNPGDLTKWQFPSVTLMRGEFLVVFASGKNRAVAGSQLHTNFSLAGSGEYLALVKPDGTTIQQEFSPTFPPQLTDVSYGLPQVYTSLVVGGDTASYHVPTIADSGLGTSWSTPTFDASSWSTGPTGFGFTTGATGDFDVTLYKANVSVPNLGAAEAVLSDPITHEEVHNESAQVINYRNTGGSGNFTGDAPFPGTQIGQDVDDFVVLVTGTVLIPSAGEWTFGVNSDDGFGLELSRDPWVFNSSFPGIRGASNTLEVFNIPEPGAYTVRLVSFERGGGSSLEFLAAQGNHPNYSTAFRLVGDVAGGGLSIGNLGALIGTDLLGEMQGINATLWSRIEFPVPDPTLIELLSLQLNYEDGFVAYLNGTEVASSNAPVPVQWDSEAVADRSAEDAGIPDHIDLTDSTNLLQPGTNVLAVHALNDSVSDGEFLVLYEMDAAEETSQFAVPEFFPEATPGSHNSAGFSGVAEAPFMSHDSGSFTGSFLLTILAVEPGAVIRYTTNGTEPLEANGIIYSGPILVNSTRQIRARVYVPGLAPGPVVTRLFSLLDPDVLDFDSNLPLVVVDTFGIGPNTSFLIETLATVIPQVVDRVSITDPPEFKGVAGIKLRGSSSLGFPKKQYAMEVWDENQDDLDVSLLGMPAESDWILYGPYSDKALMRNVLSYQWSNDIGRYAVRTRFVEMFLNTSGPVTSSDYVGVYALTEKIKRNPERVPITKLESTADAPPEITGGYIIKKDRLDPGDAGFLTAGGQRLAYVDPKEEEITQVQADYIKGYYDAFEAALNGPDFADPVLGYAAYIDVDSFIDHHLLVEMTKNIDGFRLSTFMFKDRNEKLNMGPVWDYNLSLGNANYLQAWLPTGWYNDLIGGSNYPWWDRLFEDPGFELRYADRWFAFRRDQFQTEKLLADIDAYAVVLDESQARNFTQWPILGVYVWPNWFIATTYPEEIDWMKQWLADRLDWIDGTLPAPPTFNQQGGEVPTGFNLTITAPTGTVYYTTDGTDPRLPDGSIAPTASAYGVPLVLTVPVQVMARSFDGSDWSALNDAMFYPLPLAMINEVMPDNQTIIADEQGEFEPWIELFNPFATAVELDGLHLTDDPGVPDKWPLPAGTTLCSNLTLLVWADAETADGPLHANFTLNPAGGTVYVYDATGFLVDSLTYPALSADVSYGRRPDGGAQLSEFAYSTPQAANPGLTTPIIVNEYNAVSPTTTLKGGGSDVFWGQVPGNGGEWFELVVTEDHLDLRDWEVVVEDNGGAVSVTLPFTNDVALSDLRSGTIITVSTSLPSNVSYDPANGDWWIHLRAGTSGDGLYIAPLDFTVSNDDTRITVRDASSSAVFGPAGEGINPPSGVGSDEVFKLEEDPGPFTTPLSTYNDGVSSSFGAPNTWSGGAAQQNFGALRSAIQLNCTQDSQCDDANPCTDDTCSTGVCDNAPNVASCDDGNPCTDGDVCDAGACRGEIVETCCVADCECDDGISCTSDLCVDNVCDPLPANEGGGCDDLDLCTETDVCAAGVCGGSPKDCSADDDACHVGVCDPGTGSCMPQELSDGTVCDDSDACTEGSTCTVGVCGDGSAVVCDDSNSCTLDSCDTVTGCVNAPDVGAGCDDLNQCTESDVCDGAGLCSGSAVADETGCDDLDSCTDADMCLAGICGGTPLDCTSFDDDCNVGFCNPVAGACEAQPFNDGGVCDDGNLCTDSDECLAGVCSGTAPDCSFLDDQCNVGVCDEATGECVLQPVVDGLDCDDGDLCTSDDACSAGVCVGLDVDCDDGNVCTGDSCSAGVCLYGTSGVCSVDGEVLYYRGSGSEPSAKPVPAVSVDVDADASTDAVTGLDGIYSAAARAGTLTVSTMDKFGSGEIADENDGISSLDASSIAQHSVQVIVLSAMQQIAADVSGNGTVSAFDAALVSQVAVQLLEHLPIGVSEESDWAFFRCDNYASPESQDCATPVYVHDPLTETVSDDFYALLYGDVTGNWEAAGANQDGPIGPPPPTRAGQQTVELHIGDSAESAEDAATGASGMAEVEIAALDRRRGVELRSDVPQRRLQLPQRRENAATLSVGTWSSPLAAGQQRELVFSVDDADGIVALDLEIQHDPDKVSIVSVEAAPRTSGFSLVAHTVDRVHQVGMFGVVPLQGSGAILRVTVEAKRDLGSVLPIRVSGQANETQIPLVIQPGGPETGRQTPPVAEPRRRQLQR